MPSWLWLWNKAKYQPWRCISCSWEPTSITHRLSTVRPADMIVLMEKGAVMEVGSHQQLMQRQGWYYALFQSQVQEGIS